MKDESKSVWLYENIDYFLFVCLGSNVGIFQVCSKLFPADTILDHFTFLAIPVLICQYAFKPKKKKTLESQAKVKS